jgi:hypothetical protein
MYTFPGSLTHSSVIFLWDIAIFTPDPVTVALPPVFVECAVSSGQRVTVA